VPHHAQKSIDSAFGPRDRGSVRLRLLRWRLRAGPERRNCGRTAISTGARRGPALPKAGALARPRSQDQIGLPVALTKSVIPPGSPLAPAVVLLGQKLFFDSRLSGDGTVACATCHDPARAFTDGRPVSIGIAGRAGQRNAPTILNALYKAAAVLIWRAFLHFLHAIRSDSCGSVTMTQPVVLIGNSHRPSGKGRRRVTNVNCLSLWYQRYSLTSQHRRHCLRLRVVDRMAAGSFRDCRASAPTTYYIARQGR
jgi:Di-haem cytochrome c peroxidase